MPHSPNSIYMPGLGDLEYMNILGHGRVLLNLSRSSWVRSLIIRPELCEDVRIDLKSESLPELSFLSDQNWMLGSAMLSSLVISPLERVTETSLEARVS